jgi:hypothetical protein
MADLDIDYDRAAAAFDTHVDNCPQCLAGRGCPEGDDAAEREYRAWRAILRADAEVDRPRGRSRAW